MWINNNISRPLRKGNYRTLLNSDGLGNLQECKADYFNGLDWDYMLSNRQFISYWWAEKEDYKTIADKIEAEIERIEPGVYELDKIKVNETYTISQSGIEKPKIEKNEN